MLFCISGKFIASLCSFLFWEKFPSYPYVLPFLYGILPIWTEVIASYVTKIEPSRHRGKTLLILDAAVDAVVFLLLPAFFFHTSMSVDSPLIIAALALFILAGLVRLARFVKTGLVNHDYFEGLPVTYTGYQWILLTFFVFKSWEIPGVLILVLSSFLMNYKSLKIKASR